MMKRSVKSVHIMTGKLVIAAVLASSLAGCGVKEDVLLEESGAVIDTRVNSAQEDDTNVGMGRYVEKNVFTLENWGDSHFQKTAEGEMIILDGEVGKYVSRDNGESWVLEEIDWLKQWKEDNDKCQILYVKISAEGFVVMAYYQQEEELEENEVSGYYEGKFEIGYLLAAPDGTLLSLDMNLPENVAISEFCFDETGRLFACTSNAKLFEINTADGSYKEIAAFEKNVWYINACANNILLCVSDTNVYLYDLETKTMIEDAVLHDFIENNYGKIKNYGNGYNVYLFGGEQNIIYLAGEKGLYRHVIGGSTVEQIIDGELSSFGDPSHAVKTAALLEGEEFVALFSDGRIMKFVYDAEVSAVPASMLAVYSLEENDTIRQAITVYQSVNPELRVSYEVGMQEDGITREDALKKLNTELLSGSGPDVLILDKMPYDSYMEKGVLMDIQEVVEDIYQTDGLFENLITPLERDSSLYMVPAEFQIPLIAGPENEVQNADNFEKIADMLLALRSQNPNVSLINKCSESGILKTFFMICEPSWTAQNGKLDEESLREFLIQAKRIYDAQINGTPQEVLDEYQSMDTLYMEDNGCSYEDSEYFNQMNEFDYLSGSAKLVCGTIGSVDDFASVYSLSKIEGFEDTLVKRMDGQSENIYCPVTLAGIRETAQNKEEAVLFLQTLLGEEVQEMTYYGYPVNKKAFESRVEPDSTALESIEETGIYATYGGTGSDGKNIMWNIYWPDDKLQQQLKAWIIQSDTPYLQDSVLEEAVCKEGVKYLDGSQGIDETVNAILNNMAIYMAE